MATPNTSNLVILDIQDGSSDKKKETYLSYMKNLLIQKGKINLRQKVIFFRIMATMVNASLTPLKSFHALRKQEKDKNMIQFYDYMIGKIQGGGTIHEALAGYYGVFSDAEISIIEAGERTGKLNQSLLQIAEQTEKLDSITRKIKGAMTYPLLLVVAMVVCVAVLMVKVIPVLTGFFGDPENLPAATQMVLKVSTFFQEGWLMLLIGTGVGYFLFAFWKQTEVGKYRWDGILLKMPIFGGLITKVILSRFARVFANLIESGVSILEAIRITSSAVNNEVYHQRLLLLRNDVKNGAKMTESMEEDPLFPTLLVSMLRVGEETAQIGTTIIKIADFYDEEVDIAVGSMQKMIEPLILVVMAIVIGFIAIGIFQPIMNLAGAISG